MLAFTSLGGDKLQPTGLAHAIGPICPLPAPEGGSLQTDAGSSEIVSLSRQLHDLRLDQSLESEAGYFIGDQQLVNSKLDDDDDFKNNVAEGRTYL